MPSEDPWELRTTVKEITSEHWMPMCKQSFPVDIDDIPEIEGEGTESSVDKV